ncbi:hypothetical protein, partial [Enterobacter hormaechei]|uniref:hypothetical protein n=1 Tax=Enterobacter hormaechei TaxID=158836 RepID=UPI0023E42E82
ILNKAKTTKTLGREELHKLTLAEWDGRGLKVNTVSDRFRIQDEISFVKLESVEEAYQYALKAKEILTKNHEQRQRGRGGRF